MNIVENGTYTVKTVDTSYKHHNGEKVTVVRRMTKLLDGIDESSLPPMYLATTENNELIELYQDELIG